MMQAKLVSATTVKREILGEVLPLSTPYGLNILPTNACNFQCIYCGHSCKPTNYRPQYLRWEDFKKCMDDICSFPQKIRTLLFTGLGEPLLHPNLPQMIKYAKELEVADTIRVITNGSLLTHKLSDALISAGLDSLKISIQGVSNEKYWDICKSEIDLETIIDNIQYFYENKKHTIVNVKIVNEVFDEEGDKEAFFRLFGNICDIINIEYLQEYPESDSSKYTISQNRNQSGGLNETNKICTIPFYYYSLYPDGEIVPTCALFFEDYKSISLGNIKCTDMASVWTGDKFNIFRKSHLNYERNKYKACSRCDKYLTSLCRKEDNLDNYREKLLEKY